MRCLLAGAFVILSQSAGANTDYTCLNRCTAQGYQHGYCMEVCSYGQQPQPPAVFTPRPPINYGEQMRSMSDLVSAPANAYIEARQKAEAQRAQQEQAAAQTRLLEEQTRTQQLENQRRAVEMSQSNGAGATASTGSPPSVNDALIRNWQAAAAPPKGRYPDFDAVVFAPDVPISMDMIQLMAQSQFAADIAYYLGKNKGEATKIAGMGLLDAAVAIKEIERKVSPPNVLRSVP